VARKSLHWNRDLPVGHLVARTDLVCLRPGNGLRPGGADELVGTALLRDVRKGAMVVESDLGARSAS
jgi:N-acetylneuraminate synthase